MNTYNDRTDDRMNDRTDDRMNDRIDDRIDDRPYDRTLDRRMIGDHALLLSAGSLKNTNVVNPAGENLGKLEEIMLHVDSGDVAYAVVSFGGFLGMGDKLFAVPWEALTVDTAERHIVLDVDRERLEDAPGFDKDVWPTTADAGWMEDLHRHYGGTYAPRVVDRRDRTTEPFASTNKR